MLLEEDAAEDEEEEQCKQVETCRNEDYQLYSGVALVAAEDAVLGVDQQQQVKAVAE